MIVQRSSRSGDDAADARQSRRLCRQPRRDLVQGFQFVDRAQRGKRELALQEPPRDALHGGLIDRLDTRHDLGVGDRPAMIRRTTTGLVPMAFASMSEVTGPSCSAMCKRT